MQPLGEGARQRRRMDAAQPPAIFPKRWKSRMFTGTCSYMPLGTQGLASSRHKAKGSMLP